MRAASTFHHETQSSGQDVCLVDAVLWTSKAIEAGVSTVLPDLSIDVLWLPGSHPVVLDRTVEGLSVEVEREASVVGLRFAPMVCGVGLDMGWHGWVTGDGSLEARSATLRLALESGVIQFETNWRMRRMLNALNSPFASVSSVADSLDVSVRQLNRWSNSGTGLAPKRLARLLRARRFWEADPSLSLAERSVNAGYFDQSHASNDLVALTGRSLTWLANGAVTDSSKTAILP